MENTRHIYVYSLGAFFLFVVYLCLRKQPAQPSGHALPRKATPLDPFFGLDDHIRGIIDGLSFVRNHQKYGHTYRFAPMFGISLIETAHPDNAQTVMAGKDWGVSWRQEMMGQFTGKGIITTDGEEWMKARKTVRPAFRKNVIDDLEFVGRSFDEMMEKIPVDEEKVDLQPLLYEAFMDTALHFIFGIEDIHKREPGAPCSPRDFHKVWLDGLIGMGIRMLLFSFASFIPDMGYTKQIGKIRAFVAFYLSKSAKEVSENQSMERKSVVSVVVDQADDKNYLQDNLVQAMIGAQDTTSTLTANTIELLARYPIFWDELKKEVSEKGDSLLNFDALRDNKAIQTMLKESLRLRPVFPVLARAALCDTTLPTGGGPDGLSPVFIPKGGIVDVNFYVLHRDPAVFGQDVEDFNPHRWDLIKPAPKEYIPFGIGGRACLGKDKALVEAAYVLVRLAKEFDELKFTGAERYRGEIRVTLKNKDGCKVAFRKRGGKKV